MATLWKKGRGNLGVFAPLMGSWIAEATSPMGKLVCRRTFEPVLNKSFVRLTVRWEFGGDTEKAYQEIALFGHIDGKLKFWSFTSDGKRSEGEIAEAPDVSAESLAFEAEMPAGRARFVYWPEESGVTKFIVDAQTKKGWSRMVDHSYKRV